MTTVELMKKFADPEVIKTLSFGDKLEGIGITMILGMGITVLALIIVLLSINLMTKLLTVNTTSKKDNSSNGTIKTAEVSPSSSGQATNVDSSSNQTDDLELVAVITAAIASSLNVPTNRLVIKNITKTVDTTPIWSKAGIITQMNNTL